MAGGDKLFFEIAQKALLHPLHDPEAIRYRQAVLDDCRRNPSVVHELYDLATEDLDRERRNSWYWSKGSPVANLHTAVRSLEMHLETLHRVRKVADRHAGSFRSEGFRRMFAVIAEDLDDDYLEQVEAHLHELRFERGVQASAELTTNLRGRRYIVRRRPRPSWAERLSPSHREPGLSFSVPDRDEAGAQALEVLRGRVVDHIADAAAQAADHVTSFFAVLQAEVAFYLACLNLEAWFGAHGLSTCVPDPVGQPGSELEAGGLFDPSLALHVQGRVVANDVDTSGRPLLVITGANQGGKSTFLRSVGVAVLMMQCGMNVAAMRFRATVATGVFTHHKREEDATMERGKLDEELARMSAIVALVGPGALVLCNESFASTNEREGSEIARQVIRAFLNKRIRVVFVTHMYDLAHSFESQADDAAFLRAGRAADGTRSFKLEHGAPLSTSFGEDSYRKVFAV